MTRWLLLIGTLAACSPAVLRQDIVTHHVQQEAVVMAPEAPMPVGAALGAGDASLTLAGVMSGTSARPGQQQFVPMHGAARGAIGARHGMELVASGAAGSLAMGSAFGGASVNGARGVLGRGALGMRGVAMLGVVELSGSMDLGAQLDALRRTRTTTFTRIDAAGTRSDVDVDRQVTLRMVPHGRVGTALRAPITGIARVELAVAAGVEAQSWSSYWAHREHVEVCTTWVDGHHRCDRSGPIGPPMQFVGVVTPHLGLSARAAGATVHATGFFRGGSQAVTATPWGVSVGVELRAPGRAPQRAAGLASAR
jgi:hypothetical protein